MEPIVPVFETLLILGPGVVYPYPGHLLLPDADTASKLSVRYGGLPLAVKDPRLQLSSMWQIVPNTNWWLQMPDGTGVECSQLAEYWYRSGRDHPETADTQCKTYITACQTLGQKMPPR